MQNIETIPVWILIPFAVQLLVIALAPLFAERRWENNRNKLIVSLALSVPIVIFMFLNRIIEQLAHQMLFDYLPFIILLGALFVVTGGIHLQGDILARPGVNTLFLAIGYVLASIMGTTGAAMLLIRPVLKTNDQRKFKTHTVLFFIAAVANCGGLLTPLGDPPLFLLYLRGADFTWFLNLLPEWLLIGVILLGVYYAVESYFFRKEAWQNISADMREKVPLRLSGNVNFIFLLGVVLSVAFVNATYIPAMGDEHAPVWIKFLREIALLAMIAASLIFTKKKVRRANKFTWSPILEVAAVFLGIFVTMTPALIFLNQHAASMGLHAPWQFYYATGVLSSFLDNAPTALAFYSVAQGLPAVPPLVAGVPEILLKAISLSAVFFGAMTYIGNGPNFMVKAIAEENGVKMPGFFAYMLKFSLIVLLPVYILVQLIFFP
ncbi:MAG: sodium:proton antiporter [Dysgonamonadaceae bacterium]|jgi:Na+/H+ antiporter NhaD/arsenite permease-like protein|nr:sodium:proton antiporter [Dysgonamonadaceae bacterium]